MEHVFTESMFLVGFVIFIAAILVLDMLVIDRKAHVVSIKEAGSWTAVWIILALAFAVFIYFHGDMVHGIENFDDLKLIASRYASHLKLDPNDYEGSLQQYRHYMTISYISGYLIEKTLSVDNLFVMMMIFTSFGVNKKDYQHVLNWGILGAIVLRFVFIFAGAALISLVRLDITRIRRIPGLQRCQDVPQQKQEGRDQCPGASGSEVHAEAPASGSAGDDGGVHRVL